MTYRECHNTIAKLAPALLPRFADKWSRFPAGAQAVELVQELETKTQFFYDMKLPGPAKQLAEVSGELILRADTTS